MKRCAMFVAGDRQPQKKKKRNHHIAGTMAQSLMMMAQQFKAFIWLWPHIFEEGKKKANSARFNCLQKLKRWWIGQSSAAAAAFTQIDINNNFLSFFFLVSFISHFIILAVRCSNSSIDRGARANASSELLVLIHFGLAVWSSNRRLLLLACSLAAAVEQLNGKMN